MNRNPRIERSTARVSRRAVLHRAGALAVALGLGVMVGPASVAAQMEALATPAVAPVAQGEVTVTGAAIH